MLIRLLLFVGILLVVFVPVNFFTWRQLVRIHPRRRRLLSAALVAGNLFWVVIPFLQLFNPVTRVARALLGPLWFGWQSFAILYLLFLVAMLIAWLPFRSRRAFAPFARRPSQAFLILLVVGFLAGWVQAVVPLHVESIKVEIPQLPSAATGMRVVLMGDLHVGLFTRASRLERIFRTAGELRPDVVLLAGDLIDDDPAFVQALLEGSRFLPDEVPLLAVPGNHEMYGDPLRVIEQLKGSRITMLVNEGILMRSLWIAGLSDYAALQMGGRFAQLAPDLDKALAGKPTDAMPLVFVHQPKAIEETSKRGIPLVLAAHTHGGQLGFRPFGWSLAGVFLRYHMGLYAVGNTQLYINTGTGYWLLPFRLGMSPEITLVELVPRN